MRAPVYRALFFIDIIDIITIIKTIFFSLLPSTLYLLPSTYLNMADEKYLRPTRDEYFMEVARTVAKRATCDRGRSGCVIAKNKQILCTGYVGSPPGLPHCDEVGHQFKQMTHEDGSVTNHCVRTVHAEQNAISQAAKLGVALD